ncbi:MAG: exodeoxyribonuclease VII large subunit [Acidobacteriota bacterium]
MSEINAEVRGLLERQFASVWVEGEIVNFTAAASGHWYFNLNDGSSQLKAVCWKGSNYRIRFRPQNGLSVRVRGKLSFYPARGETQLVVESLEPAGEGALRAAFEKIKAKLEAEGLFDIGLKRPMPFFPRRVGIVTSPTGAAYHDIHNVLTRRAASVHILLIPTLVQGESAADSIRQAVINVNLYNLSLPRNERIDALIVGRGGGSAEDLWAFNDELLARTLRASDIPVISAVGHEIDWTIADMVADLRAATPSAAAEIVAGREQDIIDKLQATDEKMFRIMDYLILESGAHLRDLAARMQSTFVECYRSASDAFARVSSRLTPHSLSARVLGGELSIAMLVQRQSTAFDRSFKSKSESLILQLAKLDALSPLAVLTRGFSITQSANGDILRSASSAHVGDKLKIRLEKGTLNAEVTSTE